MDSRTYLNKQALLQVLTCVHQIRELFKGKASIFTLEGPSNLCTPTRVTQKQVVGTVGTGVGQEGSGGHR